MYPASFGTTHPATFGAMSSATFGTTLEPATFYMGAAQEEALARLEWLLEQRQRLGLVVAAGGLGKSHLAAMAVRRLGGLGAEAVLVPLRGIGDGNWLEMLLDRMPLDPASRAEPRHAWQKLDDRLRENTLMERTTALVCDDIDHAPADAVEGILRLIASPEPRHSRVLVVATVRPEGLARLPDDLVRRSVVRIELEPWSSEAVANFLDLSVRRDGIAAVFSPDAAETIARLSGGVPRVVCQLAGLAVAAAAGDGSRRIDAATVERSWRELSSAGGACPPVDSHPAEPKRTATERSPQVKLPHVKAVRRLWG
jgi:general secretion pathway protein A